MKIRIVLTRGEPLTVSEEQALTILSSTEPLIALKDKDGNWSGDVLHKSHIVQMTRDYEAEKEERRKALRIDEPRSQGSQHIGNIARSFRPSFMGDKDIDR